MPGLRVVLIVGAIVVIILIVRRLASSGKSSPDTAVRKKKDADRVVSCGRCGVHVPENELVERNGRQICHECDRA